MSTSRRALPPTPTTSTKYTNVSDAIQSLLDTGDEVSLTDRERRWFNDLSNCQKSLEQKDTTIHNLKALVMEWKKKVVEYDMTYKETLQKLQDREQFLIKQHELQLQAMTNAQADQTNKYLETILLLEQENQHLKESKSDQQQLPYLNHHVSATTQLCNNAKMANQLANEIISTSSSSDELIERINEMVNAMEVTLHNVYNKHIEFEEEEPALISDVSSCCSSDEEINPVAAIKNKRSATIPNFFFRQSKKPLDAVTVLHRNHSLITRKPIRSIIQ